ncbi:hypothetical protein ESR_17597, partial [Eschrichtius robustus]|nr:hypothetical protein [Eschrichtius robustus]
MATVLSQNLMIEAICLEDWMLQKAVQSLHTLNDQISHFIVTKSKALEEDQDPFLPTEKETLKSSMILMRHLLMDAQASNELITEDT